MMRNKSFYFKLFGLNCFLVFIATSFTAAYFSDSISTSGNSFGADTWIPGPATITEVLYDPIGIDTGQELIEIKNTGQYTIDLDNYVLHFDGSGSNDLIFPDFSLLSGAKAVIHVGATGTNTATDLYWSSTGGVNMGNSHGSVVLFKKLPKDETTISDFVQYGAINQDGEPKAVAAGIWNDDTFVADVAEGHSIELIGGDNNQVTDWQDQSTPNIGS